MSRGASAPRAARIERLLRSPEETELAGETLGRALEVGDVIALSGPLGAGKTRMVDGIARGLGWNSGVRSPTFTLINEYRGRILLLHADLYRLETDEVRTLGLEDCVETGALVVEWGEKLPASLLDPALRIELSPSSVNERRLIAHAGGPAGRAGELLLAWEASWSATG